MQERLVGHSSVRVVQYVKEKSIHITKLIVSMSETEILHIRHITTQQARKSALTDMLRDSETLQNQKKKKKLCKLDKCAFLTN